MPQQAPLTIVKTEPLTIAKSEPLPGAQPTAPTSERSWLDSAADYLRESLHSLNPKGINEGVQQAFWHPIDTAKGIGQAQGQLATKAEEAFKSGDYATGLRHSLAYLIPLLGPRLDQAADYADQGEMAKSLGATTDVALQAFGPKVMKDSLPGSTRALAPNPNAAEAAAVEFGQARGIPVDAGTATGNPFVRGVQKMADQSLGGSVVGQRAQAAQARGLATVGEQLAAKSNPVAVTAEQAGTAVRDGVMGSIRREAGTANTSYSTLRAIEQQRGGIPVGIAPFKAAFEPMYKALLRERELNGVMMGDKARALNALDKLMQAPDALGLSDLDAVLGDLKSFARTDVPELRNMGQGAAAQMIKTLDTQVRQAATSAGPDAIRALEEGRKATTAKYVAAEVLDTLHAEPVRTTQGLTAPRDSALQRLRAVAQQAPDSIPQIARSVLDGFLEKATESGGFTHADKLYADWQKLGPGTKTMLFRDPAYIKELDNFFLLAKKLAENPNPSGTALTLAKGGELSLLVSNPVAGAATSISVAALSKLLHSPAGVRLLTKGFRLPAGQSAASTAYAAEVSRAIGELQSTPALVPAVAGEEKRR